jgi:putative Mg2+ transporter-C (MgtC) family protein
MAHHLPVVVVVARLAAALGLATILGLERELAAQPAGLRTHTLVSLGAATFTLLGTEVIGTDPTRIAAQVVSGVGFLGGGAILREGATVRGLTTAATLWTAAAIGTASGLGAYPAAVATAVAALLVTLGLKQAERRFFPRRRGHRVLMEVECAALATVMPAARAVLPSARLVSIRSSRAGVEQLELRVRAAVDDLAAVATKLLAVDGVVAVELHAGA